MNRLYSVINCSWKYLEKDNRRRGDEADLVEAEKLENDVAEEADWELSFMADLIEESEALLIILLHLEAIVRRVLGEYLGAMVDTVLIGFRVLAQSPLSKFVVS